MTTSPDHIGRYEIVSRIGSGGMGAVFRAHDPMLDRFVALKLLHLGPGDLRQRFLREAQVLGRLDHPNIVRTYDVGEHEGQPFLVMEMLEGRSLHDLIRGAAPMPLLKRVEIAESLARALAYAHALGVVHRDVKPSNVIIETNGVTRLLDFGIARLGDMSVTQTGTAIGTPHYMSPEQIEGRAIDGRSDIFSAGLVLYELLTAARAFDGDSITSVMFAVINNEPVPVSKRVPALGDVFDNILSKALRKQPSLRYQTATELADDLSAVRSRLETSWRADRFDSMAQGERELDAMRPDGSLTPVAASAGSVPTTRIRTRRGPLPAPTKLFDRLSRLLQRWFSSTDSKAANTLDWRTRSGPMAALPLDTDSLAAPRPPSPPPPPFTPPSVPRPRTDLIEADRTSTHSPEQLDLSKRSGPLALPFETGSLPAPKAPSPPPPPFAPPSVPRPRTDSIEADRTPTHSPDHTDANTVIGPPSPTGAFVGGLPVNDPARDGTIVISSKALPDETGSDARLVIARSPDARRMGRTIDIREVPFTLGRSSDSALMVIDPGWSRSHARIEFVNDGYMIRDLDSANGTFVNGRRIAGAQPLFFGASIRIGNTTLTFASGRDLTMPDLTGVEIAGRYILRRLIRESGKAVIYAATDTHVPREVAAKLLSPALVRFAGYREQFAREAETASQLQHPHICQLLDSGHTPIPTGTGQSVQTPFLCFELMAGGDLAERLDKLSDVGLDQVSNWIVMLGSALDYAHAQGVLHGGLKPTALVFDPAGHLYLTDFAIAQRALNAVGQPLIGSPAYIAPEQWESGAVTALTDQFAFAVVAYYLIAGARPFEGLEDPEVRAQQFRRGPEPAHDVAARHGRPPVSRVVSEVLSRGLNTAPEGRYATSGQFAAALTRALKDGRRFGDNPQVFVSYNREQSGGWVRYFADKLRDKHGIRVFMDTTGLDRAGPFPPRLVKAIQDCDVFVCFLAGSTLTSKWVNEEIRLAHEHRKVMIPVFQESYDEASLDPSSAVVSELVSFQGIRLFDVSGHYVDHAVSDLAEMIKGSLRDA